MAITHENKLKNAAKKIRVSGSDYYIEPAYLHPEMKPDKIHHMPEFDERIVKEILRRDEERNIENGAG